MTAANNRRGVIAMSVGMACFVLNDSLVKHVSDSLPPSQLIFLRGLFATLGLLLLCIYMGTFKNLPSSFAALRQRWVWVRSGLDGLASLVYLTAMFHMPLANATAINMTSPLLIALLSGFLLGVQVSLRNWLIIATGFVGVLLIVQPASDGFNGWAWVCLGGTLLHALRDISMRFVPSHIPSLMVTLCTAFGATLMAGVWSLWQDWATLTPVSLACLCGAAVLLSAGYFLLILSTRSSDLSVVAPFRYVGLLTAVVMGFVVWGDIPNTWAWCGMVLLVGAGLMMLRGQAKLAPAEN
jgi:drug/metabolite transporter (DMT)-like permease